MLIASLYLTVLLGKLLIQRETAGIIFRKGLVLLGCLLVSFLAYYIILRFFWYKHGISGGGYMSSMTDTGDSSLPALLLQTYRLLPDVLFHGAYGLITTKLSRLAHMALFAFLIIRLVMLTICARRPSSILLAVLLMLLFPVSVGAIILLSGDNVHSLVFFSFTSYYFLAGLLLDELFLQAGPLKLPRKIVCNVLPLVFLALVTNFVYVGNSAFLKLHLAYENSFSFYNSMITQVKMCPGLCPDSKLAIIGKSELFVNDFSQFPASDGIMGATGFEVNDYSYDRFIKNFVGFDIEFADKNEIDAITASEQFKQMPIYPFTDSIRAFNNIIVVKLSDPTALQKALP